jgi:hypothetical protein
MIGRSKAQFRCCNTIRYLHFEVMLILVLGLSDAIVPAVQLRRDVWETVDGMPPWNFQHMSERSKERGWTTVCQERSPVVLT